MLKTISIAALFALAAPAMAADRDDAVTAQVRIDDLDLASHAGQQQLDRRIETAARRICSNHSRGFSGLMERNRCMTIALESAAPQADRAIALARGTQRLARIDMRIDR